MKIIELNLVIGDDRYLKDTKMRALTELVVLAGPNGAGKSRILDVVNQVLSDTMLQDPNFTAIQNALIQHDHQIKQTGKGTFQEEQIKFWRRAVRFSENVKADAAFGPNLVLDFFPKAHELADHRQMNEASQKAAAQQAGLLGISGLEHTALAHIALVLKRWFAATHQGLSVRDSDKEAAISDWNSLKHLVSDLLGVPLDCDLEQQPTLFGKPIPEAHLSHGQSLLLQMAVALHTQSAKLDGLVLLLDEPECHLHPAAVIEAIQRLRDLNRLGQIWIATHCVPILAAVPPESIWYVNEGGVSWAGRRPEVVLEGLLGGPSGRERMEEFLRLPAQFAGSRFAAECLVEPRAVMTGPDDPQATQLRTFCQLGSASAAAPVRILDFGAGQGRLLTAIHERWEGSTEFREAIDYRAFEPYPNELEQLQSTITSAYGQNQPHRLIDSRDQLVTIDPHSLDVVVMCNVLHEIPPEEWRQLFEKDGIITSLLRPDGHLLILEDMELPHGEKAHRFGFLLLDSPHLYRLMGCKEADSAKIKTESAQNDRLKVHAIPASLLGRTDRVSTLETLKLLKQTAMDRVKDLRAKKPDARNGRLHALWTQLLANAELGVDALQ